MDKTRRAAIAFSLMFGVLFFMALHTVNSLNVNITSPAGHYGLFTSVPTVINWSITEGTPNSCFYDYNGANTTVLCSTYNNISQMVLAPTTALAIHQNQWQGQVFNSSINYNGLYNVSLNLYKSGTISGLLTVDLYAVDANNKPTGNPLSYGGVSTTLIGNCVDGSCSQWFVMNMSSFNFVKGTNYSIVLNISGGDASNYAAMKVRNNPSNEGVVSTNQGSTWAYQVYDMQYNITTTQAVGINSGLTNFNLVSGVNNLTFYANDSNNNLTSTLTSWSYDLAINSQTYNNYTSSGSIEPFSLNLTYDSSQFTGISVKLNYNNTNYTATQTGSGNNLVFSKNVLVPVVNSPKNMSFYWIVSLSNSTSSTDYLTSQLNQTVNTFLVDNCAVYTKKLMNLTLIDEESLQRINGTINLAISFYTSGTNNLVGTYNNSFVYNTSSSSTVCLNNITSPYDIGYTIQYYGNSSYDKKYKIVQLATITNTTIGQNISLYDVLTSSAPCAFKILVSGSQLSNYNSNLLVEANKQYLSQNQFIAVEDTLTDNDGNGILHLVQDTEVYNFIISYNSLVLGTFNNYKAHCQSAATCSCTISLNLGLASGSIFSYANYGNISRAYTYDNNSNTLSTTYVSTNGLIHTVHQVVTADDGYGNTTVCDLTGTGTSGTLTCNVPTIYQNQNLWSTLYSDNVFVENHYVSVLAGVNWYGADVLIELLMFSCLVLLFLNHPTLIIIGSVLGFVFSLILLFIAGGNLAIQIGVVAFYVATGGLAIWQISRRV